MKSKLNLTILLLLTLSCVLAQENIIAKKTNTMGKLENKTIKPDLDVRFGTKVVNKNQAYHQFSLDAGYTFSSLKENKKPNQLLFAGNGVNFGVGHRWGNNIGIASRIGFTTGSVDQAGIQSVTNGLPIPPIYLPNPKEKNYSQISLMTGPSVKLGKKHQFEINALGGIGFNPSPNTIRVDAYDANQYLYTVYQAKDKSFVGMWQVNASYKVALLSKTGKWLRILGGFGSNGVSVGLGVNIADRDCRGAMCERCDGPGCIPFSKPTTKGK